MLSYRLKFTKNTESIDPKVSATTVMDKIYETIYFMCNTGKI